jgi:hypothetical protein
MPRAGRPTAFRCVGQAGRAEARSDRWSQTSGSIKHGRSELVRPDKRPRQPRSRLRDRARQSTSPHGFRVRAGRYPRLRCTAHGRPRAPALAARARSLERDLSEPHRPGTPRAYPDRGPGQARRTPASRPSPESARAVGCVRYPRTHQAPGSPPVPTEIACLSQRFRGRPWGEGLGHEESPPHGDPGHRVGACQVMPVPSARRTGVRRPVGPHRLCHDDEAGVRPSALRGTAPASGAPDQAVSKVRVFVVEPGQHRARLRPGSGMPAPVLPCGRPCEPCHERDRCPTVVIGNP